MSRAAAAGRTLAGAAAAGLVVLLTACGDAADGEPSPELVEHAAPLVEAHAMLEAQAHRLEDDPDAAVAAWPEVAAEVSETVAAMPDPDTLDLEARERSNLVGYSRGLEVAVGAWDEVHTALEAADDGDAEQAAEHARDRMRHLDRLRAGVTR